MTTKKAVCNKGEHIRHGEQTENAQLALKNTEKSNFYENRY